MPQRPTRESLKKQYPEVSDDVLDILLPKTKRGQNGKFSRQECKIVRGKDATTSRHLARGGSLRSLCESTRSSPLVVCCCGTKAHSVPIPEDLAQRPDVVALMKEVREEVEASTGVPFDVAEIMESYEVGNTGNFRCPPRFDEEHDH